MANISVKLDKKAKNVIAKTADIGGGSSGGGVDISPAVLFDAGTKVTVDFSKANFNVGGTGGGNGNDIVDLNSSPLVLGDPTLMYNQNCITVYPNNAHTQLIANFGEDGTDTDYQILSNSVVIYEGTVEEIEQVLSDGYTQYISENLPIVEFTLSDDVVKEILLLKREFAEAITVNN